MKAISPPIPGQPQVTFMAPGCVDLPAYVFDDGSEFAARTVYTRWRLSWREQLTVALRGEIGLYQHIGRGRLQPQMIEAKRPWPSRLDLWRVSLRRAFGRIMNFDATRDPTMDVWWL